MSARTPTRHPLPVVHPSPFAEPGGRDAGIVYWRSLQERVDSEEWRARVESEFPRGSDALDDVSRRNFIQVMGAGLALAGMAGCKVASPRERIVPYTRNPVSLAPGMPRHFATASSFTGTGVGLLVTSWEGRPTKVEGNPDHPVSRGASGTLDQAAVLSLYDPHRAREFKHRGEGRSWRDFVGWLTQQLPRLRTDGGAGLRLLVEPTASPTTRALRDAVRRAFPNARFYAHAPVGRDAVYAGTRLAFGRPLEPRYDLSRAAVLLSLDADLLEPVGEGLRHAREWSERRVDPAQLSRVYTVEPMPTVTGMASDHRLRARPLEVATVARAVVAELRALGVQLPELGELGTLRAQVRAFARAVAKDLAERRGESLVVAGERQPPWVHALVHAVNGALGNAGRTVQLSEPVLAGVESGPDSLATLGTELEGGAVKLLLVTAWNPAYSSPGELGLPARLGKVPTVYLGAYEDETAPHAEWFLPAAHLLESWGDAQSADGTTSVQQPLTEPLFAGVTENELLAVLSGEETLAPYALVKAHWKAGRQADAAFDRTFDTWLAEGVVAGLSPPPGVDAKLDAEAVQRAVAEAALRGPLPEGLEVAFQKDPKAWDGRFANHAWLQELPHPVSKLTWDNVAYVSPATAERLGLRAARYERELATEVDVCALQLGGRELEVAVLPLPGHADDCVTLPLGYGRTAPAERLAQGVGFNAYLVRRVEAPWLDVGAALRKTGKRHDLAITQEHWSMEGRPIVQEATGAQLQAKPEAFLHQRGGAVGTPDSEHLPPSLIPKVRYDGQQYAWGMSVDLSRCTGCNACVLACQAENNIPVVGKEGVQRTREMHWLRIDRYWSGDEHDPRTALQPMLCQHCEAAPCEYVCPVNATVHSDEGLNDMVYNRCVGTRYCANNCPYKVRRFNFLHYTANRTPSERMAANPDVTVRARGVMEKCTFCVQRIERARITARLEGRAVGEELQTACQQACPTRVFTFGNLKDSSQEVSRAHGSARRYDVLAELGTRPRVAYLARLSNPNPQLQQPSNEGEGHDG